jgi:hypothetical protein
MERVATDGIDTHNESFPGKFQARNDCSSAAAMLEHGGGEN